MNPYESLGTVTPSQSRTSCELHWRFKKRLSSSGAHDPFGVTRIFTRKRIWWETTHKDCSVSLLGRWQCHADIKMEIMDQCLIFMINSRDYHSFLVLFLVLFFLNCPFMCENTQRSHYTTTVSLSAHVPVSKWKNELVHWMRAPWWLFCNLIVSLTWPHFSDSCSRWQTDSVTLLSYMSFLSDMSCPTTVNSYLAVISCCWSCCGKYFDALVGHGQSDGQSLNALHSRKFTEVIWLVEGKHN